MDDCLMRKFTWKGQLKKGISSDDKEKEGLFSSKLKMVLFVMEFFRLSLYFSEFRYNFVIFRVYFRFHYIDFAFHSFRGS